MQPKLLKLLEDVLDAASFIAELAHDRTLEEYREDRQLRQAIERNLEIIGEAVNKVSRLDPTLAARIGEVPRIVALRNALIHGYDLIEDERVWKVVRAQLPVLRRQVGQLLQEETREP
ncbi:MAG: DUF86 domain-containing protein [Planctomycetes bacterium]|nr:DUF86 domain-containing protein [Planctomycetota bacterium]